MPESLFAPFLFMQPENNLVVFKPEITKKVCCVYKFTLSNGYYYIGSTNNLSQRINHHLENIRKGCCSINIRNALILANSITFEIIKIDSIDKIRLFEKENISNSLSDKKCLNIYAESNVIVGFSRMKVKVRQSDKNGAEIAIYESISAAARYLKVDRSGISACVTGYRKTCKGFTFKGIDFNGNEIATYKAVRKTKPRPYIKKGRNPKNKKPIVKYDTNGVLIEMYKSIADAAKSLPNKNIETNRKSVKLILKGERKSTAGCVFKYA